MSPVGIHMVSMAMAMESAVNDRRRARRRREPWQGRAHGALRERPEQDTPIIVERVVTDIDEIVRYVRVPRLAKDARRRARSEDGAPQNSLQVQAANQDQELFDQAYGYIVQYY